MVYNPFRQSTAPFGVGSHYPTPTPTVPTVPGYAPGTTHSTIAQPGPGITSTPSTNPLLTLLGSGLAALKTALASYSAGGGGAPAATTSVGGAPSGGGAPAAQQSFPISQPITPPSYISKPISGLASIITPEEKKKKLNESALTIQQGVTAPVPTRTSWWDTIKQKLGASMIGATTPETTTTGTTLPPTGQGYVPSPLGGSMQVSPSFAEYMKQQGLDTLTAPIVSKPETQIAGAGVSGAPITPEGGQPAPITLPPGAGSKWEPPNQSLLDAIKNIGLKNAQLLASIAEYNAKIGGEFLEPGRTPEEAGLLYQQIVDQAKATVPEFAKLQDTISTIDGVLRDASIGFRKSAEALRNNPDLSMCQQTRRLQELDDMQNYAPIFDGLSMRDLISYRNQLAENMNYYSGLFQNAITGITGMTDLTTPAERMASAAEYLGKGAEWSTKAATQLQGLAELLIPTYGYDTQTNNATGEVTWIVYKTDPITGQRTIVSKWSLGNIGQRTVTQPSMMDLLNQPAGATTGGASWGNLPTE